MKINILASYVLCIILYSTCKKDNEDHDHDDDTTTKISLNWTQPADGSTVKFNDTLLIEGSANNTTEMHGYEVVITKASDTTVSIFDESDHLHSKALIISKKWKNGFSDSTKLIVKLRVAKDHSGKNNEVFKRTIWAVK